MLSVPLPLELLDIGGEGRHADAWNLNPSAVKTFGAERGQPIPRHLSGRADQIPLPDRSVRQIIMERTPLLTAGLREIARVITADGRVTLRHRVVAGRDPHAPAVRLLGGQSCQRTYYLGPHELQETVILLNTPSDFQCE